MEHGHHTLDKSNLDCCSTDEHTLAQDQLAEETRDPVCGMAVDPEKAIHKLSHQGQDYVFCSASCLGKFRDNPSAYEDGGKPVAQVPHPERRWTCSMHPEIIKNEPGSCPICGMALEPMSPSLETAENEELIDMTRRFKPSKILPKRVSSSHEASCREGEGFMAGKRLEQALKSYSQRSKENYAGTFIQSKVSKAWPPYGKRPAIPGPFV